MMGVASKIGNAVSPSRRAWVMRCALLTLVLPCGCDPQAPAQEDEPASAIQPVPVRVATATRTTLRPSVDLVGTLVAVPERTAIISPQIEGQVKSVAVLEGDVVHAGDALVHLDSRAAEARMARATGLVKEKEAILARLRRGYLPQEIEVARQSERQAKVRMETLHAKLTAMETLRSKHEVSKVEYEKIRSSSRVAEAEHGAVQARLELLEAGTPPESIAEAEAQLAIAHAEFSIAELAVEFCDVVAPIDGVVTALSIRQGMSVAPADRLALVVDLADLLVQVRIPNVYLDKVHRGARADVQVKSLPGRSFEGHVDRLSGQADPQTGDLDAFILVDNEDRSLLPGLVCRAHVWLPAIADAVVVPVTAIADRAGMPVAIVVRDNKAFEIEVSIGVETADAVQVTNGISAGDLVVTEGGYGLPEGCPVRPISGTSRSGQ